MRNISNVPIEQCGFSARLYNTLRFNGYNTTQDMLDLPVEELINQLSKQYNFGKRSASELRQWLYVNHPEQCFGLQGLLEELADLFDIEAKIKKLIAKKKRQVDAINQLAANSLRQTQAA